MIRKIILRFLITAVAFVVVIYLIPGVIFSGSMIDFLKIVGSFFVVGLLLKPILKVFALPVEIATLGLTSLVLDTLLLIGLSLWFDSFKLTSFWFSGVSGGAFLVAPVEIPVVFTALISAFLMSLVGTILYWLTK